MRTAHQGEILRTAEADPLLTIAATADLLDVGIDTVYRWRAGTCRPAGFPAGFKKNNRPRYRRSELLAWVEVQREQADSLAV